MIDFISGWISPSLLSLDKALNFVKINHDTGELIPDSLESYLGGYKLKFSRNQINIRGSLHKVSKGHNGGAFTYSDLLEEVSRLEGLLHVGRGNIRLGSFESGINLANVKFQVKQFLDSVVLHKRSRVNRREDPGAFLVVRGDHQRFSHKLYDKGRQRQLEGSEILRSEIKIKRMAHVKQAGINSLADLCDRNALSKLHDFHMSSFDDFIIHDRELVERQPEGEVKTLLNNWSNSIYLMDLKKTPHKFRHERDQVTAIQNEFKGYLKARVAHELNEVWCELLEG